MTQTRDWRHYRDRWVDLLERGTGAGVAEWNTRVLDAGVRTESELRAWLAEREVTGYAQMLLVMERFGYPDFLVASAEELVDGQYADRRELRPIYDRVLELAREVGDVEVQARKTYVSLLTPRRKFAVVKATTRSRVDLGLRLPGARQRGRLESAKVMRDDVLTVRFALSRLEEVDGLVAVRLAEAYAANV